MPADRELSLSGDDFRPTADWANLRLRAALLRRMREFFDARGFLEVETPLLSHETVVDRHLEPIAVTLVDEMGQGEARRAMWLQTSPELAMKRLLAAGGRALYQITRSFRGGEHGPRHNPEFTIVEWYRVDESPEIAMDRLSDLAEATLSRGPAERLTYAEVFERHVGLDPHEASGEELVEAARRHHVAAPAGWLPEDRDSWLHLLMAELVEPHLGRGRPAIVRDYPAGQAALAQVRAAPVPVAERFELYSDGIELANGYHELRDAAELRRRNELANRQRAADGKRMLPQPERLLSAMESGLPACCGVALGFDRLVMQVAGASRIDQVLPFPVDRA